MNTFEMLYIRVQLKNLSNFMKIKQFKMGQYGIIQI